LNDCGKLAKKSLTNWETFPEAGTVTDVVGAADVPSRLNNWRFTVTWFVDELAIATAVCIEPIAPGVPEDSVGGAGKVGQSGGPLEATVL
jgi:hypothetical protein